MELSFEALRRVQLQEKALPALQSLEEAFYSKYNEWLEEQAKRLKQDFSLELVRTYENSVKILEDILERRQQKIILKALKNLKSPDNSLEGLASEEKKLYMEIIRLLNDYREGIRGPFAKQEVQEKKSEEEKVRVRILLDIPEFIASDSHAYGPFSQKQVIELNKEVASLLLKRGAAEPA